MKKIKQIWMDICGQKGNYFKEFIFVVIAVIVVLGLISTSVFGDTSGAEKVEVGKLIRIIGLQLVGFTLVDVALAALVYYYFVNLRGQSVIEIVNKRLLHTRVVNTLLITSGIYGLLIIFNSVFGIDNSWEMFFKNMIFFVTINISAIAIQALLNTAKYEISEAPIYASSHDILKFSVKKSTVFKHACISMCYMWIYVNLPHTIYDTWENVPFVARLMKFFVYLVVTGYILLFAWNFFISLMCDVNEKLNHKYKAKQITNLTLRNINISAENFNELPTYNLITNPKQNLPTLPFLLELSDLFPEGAKNKKMYFEGYNPTLGQ